jgi:hypothetical protein
MTFQSINSSHRAFLGEKIFARFTDDGTFPSLSEYIMSLFSQQRESWQKLKDAYGVLKTVKTRHVPLDGCSALLYNNPGRLTSATAAVGQKDLEDRPCFLCLQNLSQEQKGILYREAFIILYNPMPVFPHHLTVAHVEHRPQAISGFFDTFLLLTTDLGKKWIVLYNGPKCGASAPDHLHFQAIPSGWLPIENELRERVNLLPATRIEDVQVFRARDLGREVIVLEGKDQGSMVSAFVKVLATLRKIIPTTDEPMVNVAGLHDGQSWRIAIFPRQKHRPDVFFREGEARVVVSPGVVEMAGVLVTPMVRDFERLDTVSVKAIYREVSLDKGMVTKAIEVL